MTVSELRKEFGREIWWKITKQEIGRELANPDYVDFLEKKLKSCTPDKPKIPSMGNLEKCLAWLWEKPNGMYGTTIRNAEAELTFLLAVQAGLERPEWISVKDRLPENKIGKLVKVKTCGKIVHFQAYYDSTQKYWVDWCGDTDKDDGWEVTHWMPLPTLPEEE